MTPKATTKGLPHHPASLDALLNSRRIKAMASKIRHLFSESTVVGFPQDHEEDEASLTSISSDSSDWSAEAFEDDPSLDRLTLRSSANGSSCEQPPEARQGLPGVVEIDTAVVNNHHNANNSRLHKERTETKTPSPSPTLPPPTILTAADRQALWLVWTTLQVNADVTHHLDDTETAVGKLMLQKLYTWNPQRARACLQCPPPGKGGILAEMARHIFALKMGHACHGILREVCAVLCCVC
jgi:hypothetical protein